MSWVATFYPACRYHVFLSHSRENHDDLVRPVFDRLVERRIEPWIDRHHYAYGADSRTALQSALIECRHVVFFVTDQMIASPRGWCVLELAYAELLQRNLSTSAGPLTNVFLPLYFVPQSHPLLPRTVWQAARDRGAFHDPAGGLDRVSWATDEILAFLRREQRSVKQLATRVRTDSSFGESIATPPGLRRRVTKFDPQAIPEE